jgi:quinol-cytochrome oxidoreductase complex cytochrome b subunit
MIVTIIISLILWFVVPLLIDGRVKRKSDRKAYKILCRIIAIAILAVAVFGSFM